MAVKCCSGSTEYDPTDKYEAAVIGWAGQVAEEIAINEILHRKETDFENLWEDHRNTEMSETDHSATCDGGERMQRKAFKQAVAFLKSHRRHLKRAAQILMKRGYIDLADLLDV